MQQAERRRCSRFPFDLDCIAEFSRVYREVTLRNVSMQGALIEAQNLAVHFDGPDCIMRIRAGSGRVRELPATVARGNAQNLVALSWVHADNHSQRQLRQLIWMISRDTQAPARSARSQPLADTAHARPATSGRGGKSRFGGALVVWEETLLVQGRRSPEDV